MKVIIPLANGCEEIEVITNIDVLRRAGVEVETISLKGLEVKGAHNIIIKADKKIDELNIEEVGGIILPGGMPGAANLRDDKRIINIVQKLDQKDGLIAAICAAPIVLEAAGVIRDRPATSYPGFGQEMESCTYLQDRVVVDDNLITGRGPGVALEFALKIVELLVNKEKAEEIKVEMISNF
ncbi:DJ-1 family glyoxalase III [Orenia marismortui]|uniref:4-methyl-5(B-hydroxyethyl)-thiazole monophosphate biosynthesis n=1 Tax=Orenia marismortui TaxID=46469 RepID=A0A4R8H003_9FIRM|nr:DJ-1 family glyoxalase III [Orenia marismortui]TDX52347.1 4-methyl-5(b-hydroxyethyl)-thiazole monophosphate biosynthesis [Orenia marismortui]